METTVSEYTLLIKAESAESIKDLVADFGFVVLEMPFIHRGQAKDLAKNDWCDEDGEDVYIPTERKFKGREMSVKVGYTGEKGSSAGALDALEFFLSQNGALKIYSEWVKDGYEYCSYSGIADEIEYDCIGDIDILEATLTFAVHDTTRKWDGTEDSLAEIREER